MDVHRAYAASVMRLVQSGWARSFGKHVHPFLRIRRRCPLCLTLRDAISSLHSHLFSLTCNKMDLAPLSVQASMSGIGNEAGVAPLFPPMTDKSMYAEHTVDMFRRHLLAPHSSSLAIYRDILMEVYDHLEAPTTSVPSLEELRVHVRDHFPTIIIEETDSVSYAQSRYLAAVHVLTFAGPVRSSLGIRLTRYQRQDSHLERRLVWPIRSLLCSESHIQHLFYCQSRLY